ncbi:hypothetical protein HRbin26_01957 [bacterium HR26]|nr:hypothetical protein HRbin26_01957 [bacterium HR26]
MHRAHADAGFRQAGIGEPLGDAEIGDLDRALLVHQDVLGLDVAMDEAMPVGVVERGSDLADDVGGVLDSERCLAQDQVLERLPAHVLHDDVVDPVVMAYVVDVDDVRMGEARGRLGLTLEASQEVRVAPVLPTQDLDRHGPVEGEVVAAVDHSHASLADQFLEAVSSVEDFRLHPRVASPAGSPPGAGFDPLPGPSDSRLDPRLSYYARWDRTQPPPEDGSRRRLLEMGGAERFPRAPCIVPPSLPRVLRPSGREYSCAYRRWRRCWSVQRPPAQCCPVAAFTLLNYTTQSRRIWHY